MPKKPAKKAATAKTPDPAGETTITPAKPVARKKATKAPAPAVIPAPRTAIEPEPAPAETDRLDHTAETLIEIIESPVGDAIAPVKGNAAVTVTQRSGTVGRTREDLPTDAALARAIKAQPQLTSAALAIASVAHFGDSAREQADWLRTAYPKVGPERLATASRWTRRGSEPGTRSAHRCSAGRSVLLPASRP